MVRAWYLDGDPDKEPAASSLLSMDVLKRRTGIIVEQIDLSDRNREQVISKMRQDRGYPYEGTFQVFKTQPDYAEITKNVKREHFHGDAEVRLFTEGGGYFDARDADDKWIRIEFVGGDLLNLPGGCYHRFSLGKFDGVKLRQYFSTEREWKAYYRSDPDVDSMQVRTQYLASLTSQ